MVARLEERVTQLENEVWGLRDHQREEERERRTWKEKAEEVLVNVETSEEERAPEE